jgi:hypothetical protein
VALADGFSLEEHRFLNYGSKDTLVLKFKNDPLKPLRKISLYNADDESVDEDGLPIPVDSIETVDDEVSFEISSWGRYYFKITATANRTPKTLETSECFITDHAATPGLKELSMVKNGDSSTKVSSTIDNTLAIDGDVRDLVTLNIDVYDLEDEGAEYTVKETNPADGTEVSKTIKVSKYNISNNLTYTWEVSISDITNDYVPVKEAPLDLIDKEADISGSSISVNVL